MHLLLLLLLLLLPEVLLVPVVLLVLQVFLLPGALPLLLLLGVHLLGVVPLPIARELLPITHPLPMTIATVTVTTAITLVHLYAVTCMVALGALRVRYGADGADGAPKNAGPGPFPRHAPLNSMGRGVIFGIPCPCPASCPRPTHTPHGSPLKIGGNKWGPSRE